MRNVYSYPEPDGVDNRIAEDAAAYESEGLPNLTRPLEKWRVRQDSTPFAASLRAAMWLRTAATQQNGEAILRVRQGSNLRPPA